MFKPESAFIALVNRNGLFLTVRRHFSVKNGELWALPGGKADEGETALQAGVRELSEELGLAVDPKKHGYLALRSGKNWAFVVPWIPTAPQHAHLITLINGKMHNPEEIEEVKWQSWREICSIPRLHKSLEILALRVPADLDSGLFEMLEHRLPTHP